jgi:hypothetical protein
MIIGLGKDDDKIAMVENLVKPSSENTSGKNAKSYHLLKDQGQLLKLVNYEAENRPLENV